MPVWQTAATELLGITVPVVQAPMAGGPTTPALAAAVSAAGGLGSLAGGYLEAARLREEIQSVRATTSRPFAVNVFAPEEPADTPDQVDEALRRLEPYRLELGLPPRPARAGEYASGFDEQLKVLLEERPPVVSFTFGLLSPEAVEALHAAGCLLVGTATTVAEAVALVASGADVVCAQGAEAGAHRGTFLHDPRRAVVGTMALVPQVADAVEVPVVAAGGIMDGRGLAAALALGASAAQLGTAFLRCPEAGTSASHRRALDDADEAATVLTPVLTGKLARGIDNRLIRALDGFDVPPYPIMHALTSELRRTAARQGVPDLMALWAGQGVRLGTELPAAQLVGELDEAAGAAVEKLGGRRASPG